MLRRCYPTPEFTLETRGLICPQCVMRPSQARFLPVLCPSLRLMGSSDQVLEPCAHCFYTDWKLVGYHAQGTIEDYAELRKFPVLLSRVCSCCFQPSRPTTQLLVHKL